MSHPSFFRALDPGLDSSGVLICLKLETLVPHMDRKKGFDVQSITNMTAVRASRGARLKCVQIEGRVEFVSMSVVRKTEEGRVLWWFLGKFSRFEVLSILTLRHFTSVTGCPRSIVCFVLGVTAPTRARVSRYPATRAKRRGSWNGRLPLVCLEPSISSEFVCLVCWGGVERSNVLGRSQRNTG